MNLHRADHCLVQKDTCCYPVIQESLADTVRIRDKPSKYMYMMRLVYMNIDQNTGTVFTAFASRYMNAHHSHLQACGARFLEEKSLNDHSGSSIILMSMLLTCMYGNIPYQLTNIYEMQWLKHTHLSDTNGPAHNPPCEL
ncbi:hypothetical protein BaRGS_00019184 [Batillaria attramentaria]|uniref:Uncharacterized protein n=1 Tax=Batillaria attramentaria TaxID=370345 RepID=A0ABD0KS15_9CAEN